MLKYTKQNGLFNKLSQASPKTQGHGTNHILVDNSLNGA